MRIPAILVLFILGNLPASAQNRAAITGRVVDSLGGQVLELATIAVVNPIDSGLVSYTITNKTGRFTLNNLPVGQQLKVVVSYVGYANFRKIFNLKPGTVYDLGNIRLSANTRFSEVFITAERPPVSIRKDTIEFSAEAFKTRPNAVVEDLLKKLPGIQVDVAGTITVNGKNVSKILVEGKEFFGNNYRIATKNLNADLIDKVQVMDDHENDPDRLKDASEVDKIINLKLKKAVKRSTFGKVYAGQGTNARFEAGGLLNMLKDTLQVSLIGFGNNVNQAGFSNNDLSAMGGFKRGDVSTGEVGTGLNGYGIQKMASAGFNLNNDWGKTVKANLMYFYGNTTTLTQNSYHNTQLFTQDAITTRGEYEQRQVQNKHTVGGKVVWTINPTTEIRFAPRLGFSLSNTASVSTDSAGSNLKPRLHQSNVTGNQTGAQTAYGHLLMFYKRLQKKGETLTITNNVQLSPGNSNNYSFSNNVFYDPAIVDTRNQFARRGSGRSFINLEAIYRRPFTAKAVADITASAGYEHNGELVSAYRLNINTGDYDLFQPGQSNDLDRFMYTYSLKPRLTFIVNRNVSFIGGVTLQSQHIKNTFGSHYTSLAKNDRFILPSFRFSAKNFSVSYDLRVVQPGTASLQPLADSSNILFIKTGNPNLLPEKTHNINISCGNYNANRQAGYNFSLTGGWKINTITDKQTIDQQTGAQDIVPVNVTGNYFLNTGFSFNKRFTKKGAWQISLSSNTGANVARNHFILNQNKGTRNNYIFFFIQNLSANWKDIVDVQPFYRGFLTNSNSYGPVINNFHAIKHEAGALITVHWPQKLVIEGRYLYRYNSQVSNTFNKSINMLNASISLLMLKKNKGQLTLAAYDLLNQNAGIDSYAYNNIIGDATNNVLKQYFMLSYTYNFNIK